jgi:SAM-dependent methyltransferase
VDRADPPPLRHRGLQVQAMKEYYDRRAPEYDDWYLGTGLYADRERPSWDEELHALERLISWLPPSRTLDVACGTGFLTQHLRGEVVGLDQSESMLNIARNRVPEGSFVQGDAFSLPFPDSFFDRILTGHFYGHLHTPQRQGSLQKPTGLPPSWWSWMPLCATTWKPKSGRNGYSQTGLAIRSTRDTSPEGAWRRRSARARSSSRAAGSWWCGREATTPHEPSTHGALSPEAPERARVNQGDSENHRLTSGTVV